MPKADCGMNGSILMLARCDGPCLELAQLLDAVLSILAPHSKLKRKRKAQDHANYEACVLAFLRLIAIVALEGLSGFRTAFDNGSLSALGFRTHAKVVRDDLQAAGLIEVLLGFYNPEDPDKSLLTLITPTPRMLDLVRQSGVKVADLVSPPRVTTVLKKAKAKPIPDWVKVQDRTVRRYNDWIGGFCLHRPDGSTSTRIHLVRIFTGDWHSGGRHYTAFWIDMPREERATLLIDGEETCELDYKSLHPAILYAQKGKALDFDPYTVPGFDQVSRETGKKVFNALLNGKKAKLSPQSCCRKHFPTTAAMNAFVDAMREHLGDIKHHFGTQAWTWLQKADSELALKVMESCMNENIPVFPIHDGFLIRKCDSDKVLAFMNKAFHDAYGLLPRIEAK